MKPARSSARGLSVAGPGPHPGAHERLRLRAGPLGGRAPRWGGPRPREHPGRLQPLDDLLAAHPRQRFMLDLKDRSVVPALARAVRAAGAADRVCLAGNDDALLADARAVLGPGVAAAMGWRSTARLVTAARTGTRPHWWTPAPFVHVPLRFGRVPVFAGRLVAMAHELGARVLVWTVDDPADMRRVLDAGVHGLITDRRDLARDVLIARGEWRAPAPAPPVRAGGPAPGPRRGAPTGA